MAGNIKSIEKNLVCDNTSPTGLRQIGFDTCYENSLFLRCCALFSEHSRSLTFYTADGCTKTVQLDERIEELGIYHSQYGIAVSDAQNCFFVTSWGKGIYCCSLDTGEILWNYKLKHATKIFLYDDYLVCAFQEIGLRKISYEGKEIAKYPFTTYDSFFRLDDPYIFCGPKRGMHYIIDTQTMDIHSKIESSVLSPSNNPDDESLIIVELEGSRSEFTIRGWQNHQRFEKRIRQL